MSSSSNLGAIGRREMDLFCPVCRTPLQATATGELTVIVCSKCAHVIRIPHDGSAHALTIAATASPEDPVLPSAELDTTAPFDVETSLEADERRSSAAARTFAPGTQFGDYEILEEIARGGMGVVYKARQVKLNRIVALKVIRGGHLASEEQVRRFYVEAEAAAHLDHPGIVPVYEVGQHRGQHFYSMGFVEGTSLSGRLAAGPLPTREAAELMRKATIAVAYAHERGVIHRDLKPSNILLDAQGQPRVADFGLAKRIETDSELTATGQPIGTPSYMPPEQAAGRIDEVGPLADVYSLGATLYCLVTGRPPFQAANADETRRQVIEQEPVAPRQLNNAVDRDLETICLKCLQKEPARRYGSSSELADDLQRYLDGRPIAARPISRTARFVRWCRRNPRVAMLSAALLLALLGGLAATELRRREVVWERDQKDEALQAKTQAFTLTMNNLRKLTDRVVEHQIARRTVLTDDDRRFLREIQQQYEEFAKLPGEDVEQRAIRAEGHFRVALMRHRLGDESEAETSYRQALALYEQLTADFPMRPDFRRGLAQCHNDLGVLLSLTTQVKEAEAAYAEAVTIRKQLAAAFPTNPDLRHELARSHNNLGLLLIDTGRLKEAEMAYADSLAIRKQLVADFPARADFRQDLAGIHNNLANLHAATGRLKEAETAFVDALAICKQLAEDFPARPEVRQDLARSHNNFGALLRNTGWLKEAETAYANALAIQKQLAAEFPTHPDFRQELGHSHSNLATLYYGTGRVKQADAAYDNAVAIRKQLATDFPMRADMRHELAGIYESLGNFLSDTGRLKEAQAAYADALEIYKQLAADFPARPEFRDALAESQNSMGNLLADTGQSKEAEAAYADALAIRRQLAADFPNVPEWQNDLAGTLVNLAVLGKERGDFVQARRWLEEALPHHQAALKANPAHPEVRQFYRNNRVVLALSCAGQGNQAAAVEAAGKVRDLGWDPPRNAYDAACTLALCVPIVGKEYKASKEDREKQTQFYADQAMAMLREAVARGFHDAAHLKNDPDLAPLRKREDFQKLLAELEKAGAARR
jgi:tetratricopeptide (TPR) repeat protein/tRNA A-37 threonylcarbamoyl transferase component Bud32